MAVFDRLTGIVLFDVIHLILQDNLYN